MLEHLQLDAVFVFDRLLGGCYAQIEVDGLRFPAASFLPFVEEKVADYGDGRREGSFRFVAVYDDRATLSLIEAPMPRVRAVRRSYLLFVKDHTDGRGHPGMSSGKYLGHLPVSKLFVWAYS